MKESAGNKEVSNERFATFSNGPQFSFYGIWFPIRDDLNRFYAKLITKQHFTKH